VPTDEELMLLVAKGSLEAFEQIIVRYQSSAWKIAYQFLRDSGKAEDMVQEAFLKILDAAPRYRPRAPFRTYLYRILSRLCLDERKKKKPVYTGELPDLPHPSSALDDQMISKERMEAVYDALDALPDRQRLALVLKYYDGLDYREIAAVMETTPKAVERLLARGRALLEKGLCL
jgi:RNA polymerase sigma-70 factor (ECF subfamily)